MIAAQCLQPSALSFCHTRSSRIIIARLGSTWQDRALDPNIFYDPPFALAALRHLPARDSSQFAFVWDDLVKFPDPPLVAVIPLKLTRRWPVPFRAAIAWHHPFAVLTNPLLAPGMEAMAFAALFDQLARLRRPPRYMIWPLLADGTATARALLEFADRTRRTKIVLQKHYRAQFVCDARRSFQESLPSKRLRQVRRQRRRLEESGKVEFVSAAHGEALKEGLDAFLALEVSGWKGRAGTAARSQPETAAFVRAAVTGLAEAGKVRIDQLLLDGKSLAATITLRSGSAGALWKIAYSEAHARFAPGVQLLCEVSEAFSLHPSHAAIDSCAVPGHTLIESLWPDRLSIANWLVFVRPDEAGFSVRSRFASESVRLRVLSQTKRMGRFLRNLMGKVLS